MSAITTHYRRVHGESSGSLGDLTWITADSFVQPSQAVNIAYVKEALSFVSAGENGRRLEMDLKLRGAGDSTRSSGSGYCIVIHEISD